MTESRDVRTNAGHRLARQSLDYAITAEDILAIEDEAAAHERRRLMGPGDIRLRDLARLSDAATPGPWIRKRESLDVHHMFGDDALRSQADIDFAVAAVGYVRSLLSEPSR